MTSAAEAPVTEADAIRLQAQLRPGHPALIFRGSITTYAELDVRSNQVANGLLEMNLIPSGRIAILARNSTEYFEWFFGVIKAGMTALPINWRLAPAEIAAILVEAEARILFIEESFESTLPSLRKLVPALNFVIFMGGRGVDGFAGWRDARPIEDPSLPARPEDIMVQFYTSGTTGNPKGVQISHRSSRSMRSMEVRGAQAWMDWGPQDVAIVALPNFHLSGTSWALQWLARGATCVVQEQVDANEFLQAIADYSVTQLFAVPTVIAMMLDSPRLPLVDIRSLKVIYYGGAPISASLLRRAVAAFRCSFVQIYGMTENNGTVCYLDAADHAAGDESILRSCGRPLPDISLRIMDSGGNDVAQGTVGEVCIESPSLMSGYWKREALRGESFHGAYYRTGDAGYRNADGYLFLVDRLKDMIVSGGENIYPAEVERALLEHPYIVEAAVIGVSDSKWGEAVKAVVVRRDAVPLSEAEVIAWIKTRIAGYKAPKSVAFVAALPRNANGKVLKRALREEFAVRQVPITFP